MQAAILAKKITGRFANCRPDDAATFIEGIADVIEQFPAGLVEECADARRGIAAKVEFLSVKSLTEWLDKRLAFYQSIASYIPPARQLPAPDLSEEEHKRGRAAWLGLRVMIGKNAEAAKSMTFDDAVKAGADAVESGSLLKPMKRARVTRETPAVQN